VLNRILAGVVLSCSALISTSAIATESLSVPNPSKAEVEEIFGDRFSSLDRAEELFLMAVGFDNLAADADTAPPIGIPYIVRGGGAGYWAMLYMQGERSTEVLVNNALILLFMQSPAGTEAQREAGAMKLLEQAAQQGYWPADVYIAQSSIARSIDKSLPQLPSLVANLKRAHAALMRCANVQFAPCQIDLGVWMMTGDVDGTESARLLLQRGLDIAARDTRYLHNKRVLKDIAGGLDLLLLPNSGITEEQRAEYEDYRLQVAGMRAAMGEEIASR